MSLTPFYAAATWIVPLVIAITFHEVAHGLVANAFGDTTARDAGRLTFNPLRHVDPMGTVMIPLLLAVTGAPIFGWAKPVPVRPGNLRHPRRDGILVTAAGPAMNLLIAAVAAILLAFTLRMTGADTHETLALFLLVSLNNLMMANLFLGLFNLLPIPPLDGGRIVAGLLPRPLGRRFALLGRYGFVILMVLLVLLPMITPEFDFVARYVSTSARAIGHGLLSLFMGR